jgi:hypothetical protein
MSGHIDYTTYSTQQLREAEAGIDQARFPENSNRLREELIRRGETPVTLTAKRVAPSQAIEMPKTASSGVKLMWTSICIGVLNATIHWSQITTQAPVVFAALILLTTFGTTIWLTHKISLGRNWARITFLILTILGSTFYVARPSLMFAGPTLEVVLATATAILQLAALVLFFLHPSNQWFRSIRTLGRAV